MKSKIMSKLGVIIPMIVLLFQVNNNINAQKMNPSIPSISPFPIGAPLPEQFSKYFIGQAYLATLTNMAELNSPVANVTFEPRCRNNWHKHTGGQLLIAVGGSGFYQEKGKPARILKPGTIVEIAPNVEHWHGAAPDSWFSHLAIETNPQNSETTWLEPVDDAHYNAATAATNSSLPAHGEEPLAAQSSPLQLTPEAANRLNRWFHGSDTAFKQNDPELYEILGNFTFGETQAQGSLSEEKRILITIGSCVALGAHQTFLMMLRAANNQQIAPEVIKEVIYQAVPYVGIARVADFLEETNQFLLSQGVPLPLKSGKQVENSQRWQKGYELQKKCFGDAIDAMYQTAPANQAHFQRYLSANCFGDYQTRTFLDVSTRELLTFAMLISLGGCEPQVKGHIMGNVAVGNDKETLIATVTQLLPYIGYPRTLNALKSLNEVLPEANPQSR